MTPKRFRQWRDGLRLTQAEAAEALGIGLSTLQLYERGRRFEDDRPVEIPRTVALACAALEAGLDALA
jgi:transcriptional regulator with XRE-family HTH domain